MKTKNILRALALVATLPTLAFAQVANDANSPTSSADGGVQKVKTPDTAAEGGPTSGAATDVPKLSKTNTQTGGAVDTGTPKDDAAQNPNIEHSGPADTSMKTVPAKSE